MKKFCVFFLLVGAVSMLMAQKLQKTALTIDDLKMSLFSATVYGSLYGFGADENNYYVYCDVRSTYQGAWDVKYLHWGKNQDSYFVINKKFSTVTRYVVMENKDDRFLKITLADDDVVILVARNQKEQQKTQIIKQTYAKTTGKLKKETVIASFPKSKSEHWYFYSSASPDKTKNAFMFMTTNKNNADGYYVAVLDETYNMEWNSEYDLELSNNTFSTKDFTITDKGEIYIAFVSYPKTKSKESYIDLVYLAENEQDKMSIPIEKYHFAELRLKPLKSGDVYLAALFSNNKTYAGEFYSLKLNGKNFNDGGSHTKEITEKNIRVPINRNYSYHLEIMSILELDNGNIAVICEQGFTLMIVSNNMASYQKARGSVTTFFVNGSDASIEDVSVMSKTQICGMTYDIDARKVGGSISPFVYGNKVAYLFNDSFKKYAFPAKYKENKKVQYPDLKCKDVSLVLSTQESGEKAKIDVLTGKTETAGRMFRQILFRENDRLILLTRDKKGGYIETLSLP